ncbi:hypothetical protein C8R44DRAFT_348668 [Mycena epipterygia]|nr:hypothetical protein C8R44DRAFT_348668 [Mycena epipterygia]
MSSAQNPGDPLYRRNLGDSGLVLRWSTPADKAGCIIVSCLALGVQEGQEKEWAVRYGEPYTDDAFFSGSSANWALCVDTTPIDQPATNDSQEYVDGIRAEAQAAPERVVALVYFLPGEFSFDGDAARMPVGKAHIVACRPAYRATATNENIVKALFEMVHARALSTGCAFMAISGIRSYYRTHGYEYALRLGRGLVTHIATLRPANPPAAATPPPFTLRLATLADLPALESLVTVPRATANIFAGVSAPVLQAQLRWLLGARAGPYAFPVHPFYVLEKRDAPDAPPRVVAAAGLLNSGVPAAAVHPLLWDGIEDASAVALAVVRQLVPALEATFTAEGPKLTTIRWVLTDAHPLRRWLIAHELAVPMPASPKYEAASIWWAALLSVPAFLRALAPALTARLARAAPILGANYVGSLSVGGVVLRVAEGKVSVEDAPEGSKPTLALPRGALIQLLLGYAPFAELKRIFPDVAVEPALAPLVDVLFPACEGVGATMVGAHYFIGERMTFK